MSGGLHLHFHWPPRRCLFVFFQSLFDLLPSLFLFSFYRPYYNAHQVSRGRGSDLPLPSSCVPFRIRYSRLAVDGGVDAFAATVPLYLLDEDGIPLTADPVGTDNSGHTTWRLGVGVSSGTFTSTPTASFPSGAFGSSTSSSATYIDVRSYS